VAGILHYGGFAMNIIAQLALIFAVCFAGEGISGALSIQFPASVVSLLLMIFLLFSGVVKEQRIRTVSDFFLSNMGIFFVPACVGVAKYFDMIRNSLLPFLLITGLTTPLIYGVTAWSVQLLMRRARRKKEARHD